jgi:hypothetical protein
MKERDRLRAEVIDGALTRYEAEKHPLLGIDDPTARSVFVQQLIESLHRVEYPRRIRARRMSVRRIDPTDAELFDPLRGAVYCADQGNCDEACWLVFLFVAFGKGKRTGWRLVRDIYGRLGQGGRWDWPAASAAPGAIAQWIKAYAEVLWPPGTFRPFGAHRQHERIALSAQTVETYLRWIGPAGHQAKFNAAARAGNGDPRASFDILYCEMDEVYRFGRLAKFDYVAMLGKLDLAKVEPGSTYMAGATGPVSGARLLFANDPSVQLSAQFLDEKLADLDQYIAVGMQAIEDALCNWQKSPRSFKPFRG